MGWRLLGPAVGYGGKNVHTRGPVYCKPKEVGTPLQTYKRKRGGRISSENKSPCGWKLRPAKVLARALAERNEVTRSLKALKQKAHGVASETALKNAVREVTK